MRNGFLAVLAFLMAVGPVHALMISDVIAGVPPDNPLYIVKIAIERVDLALPIGDAIAKRESLAGRRINEAYYMAVRGNSNEAQKLVIKSEEMIMEIKIKFHPNATVEQEDHVEKYEKLQRIAAAEEKYKNSISVLQGLLADPNMPESSRKGLETALEAVQKHIDEEIDELDDEAEEIEDEVDDDDKEEIRIKVRGIVETPDLSSCAGVVQAQVISNWRNPRTGEAVEVSGSCVAQLYNEAGWMLMKESPNLGATR